MTGALQQIGAHQLYRADCVKFLGAMAANSVDLVLTDPPYEAHMHRAKSGARGRKIRGDGYAELPSVDFSSIEPIREAVAKEIVRVCRGWALVFCTPEGIAPWRDALESAGAKYKRACFWLKPDSAPQFNGQCPAMGVEAFVAVWCGTGCSKWNGGGRRNWFEYLCQPPERDGRHPTEKPVALLSDLIGLFSKSNATILDPFAGSGSTGVACEEMGRRFIGVEVSDVWFDICNQRLGWACNGSSTLERVAGRARLRPASGRAQAPVPLFGEAAE